MEEMRNMAPKETVRQACRNRRPLDGVDAQALEHALTITERERDQWKSAAQMLGERIHEATLALNVIKAIETKLLTCEVELLAARARVKP
jgi:hypothetical protein